MLWASKLKIMGIIFDFNGHCVSARSAFFFTRATFFCARSAFFSVRSDFLCVRTLFCFMRTVISCAATAQR